MIKLKKYFTAYIWVIGIIINKCELSENSGT